MTNPMMMISGLVQMETYSDDIEPNYIEDEVRDHMMVLQCPTEGLYNILGFAKPSVRKIF